MRFCSLVPLQKIHQNSLLCRRFEVSCDFIHQGCYQAGVTLYSSNIDWWPQIILAQSEINHSFIDSIQGSTARIDSCLSQLIISYQGCSSRATQTHAPSAENPRQVKFQIRRWAAMKGHPGKRTLHEETSHTNRTFYNHGWLSRVVRSNTSGTETLIPSEESVFGFQLSCKGRRQPTTQQIQIRTFWEQIHKRKQQNLRNCLISSCRITASTREMYAWGSFSETWNIALESHGSNSLVDVVPIKFVFGWKAKVIEKDLQIKINSNLHLTPALCDFIPSATSWSDSLQQQDGVSKQFPFRPIKKRVQSSNRMIFTHANVIFTWMAQLNMFPLHSGRSLLKSNFKVIRLLRVQD